MKTKEEKREYSRKWREANKEKEKERHRQYREANKEKEVERSRQYRENNKEKLAERDRKYRDANKEKVNEGQRQYRVANREKEKERHRQYYEIHKEEKAEYYEANKQRIAETNAVNKDKIAEYNRQYREAHPEVGRIGCQRRRARKKELKSTLTLEEWQYIVDQHFGCCHYCGTKTDKLHQEHKIPVSKGGGYTKENIVPACPSCNRAKYVSDYEEFIEETNERLQLKLL